MNKNESKSQLAIIADDEDTGRMLLADAVEEAGLTPIAVDNGIEALEAALAGGAALVLLDVEMPGMDGYAVCKRLREDPRFLTVPIVMVTGHEDSAAIGLAFKAGATDFISKPVNWALLPWRLEYIMRNAAAAERIEQLAYFDPLTGLANRQRCLETSEAQFALAGENHHSVATLYLDLNSLKRVNDTFGHSSGDAVLCTVADRLKQVLQDFEPHRKDGTGLEHLSVSRFGGDEFVILARHADARQAAAKLSQAVITALKEPIVCNGLDVYASPSIGVAVYPDDGEDVAEIFKHADTAMYHAKSSAAEAIAVYDPSMSAKLKDWLELESRLRRAVRENGLYLEYQPKFRLKDDQLVGVEALARWRDGEWGNISPERFIEIAEDSGLILELGHWTIRAACQQLRRWLDAGIRIPIAVNVSGKELLYGDPARVIELEAAAANVPTSLLEVELTESVFVTDSPSVRNSLERLRQLGCRIALDDFGTGYSALGYVTRFPPDRLKIDRHFMLNVDRSAGDAAVANTILTLGASLGSTVTAEGVERQSQLDWLRERGCDEVQGFILSRPLSAEVLETRYFADRRISSDPHPQPAETGAGTRAAA